MLYMVRLNVSKKRVIVLCAVCIVAQFFKCIWLELSHFFLLYSVSFSFKDNKCNECNARFMLMFFFVVALFPFEGLLPMRKSRL